MIPRGSLCRLPNLNQLLVKEVASLVYTTAFMHTMIIDMATLFPDLKSPRISPTGYSIYTADAAKRKKQNSLEELYPKLPDQTFDIIYADPPWDYGGKLQFDKSSKGLDKIDLSKKIFISSAVFKYPTLKLAELMKLRVQDIAEENCLLFMWATSPHLQQALELGTAWGFQYRTIAFVWDKMSHNPGKYTLSNCELCLVFKRGKIPSPRGVRNIQQLIRAPRRKHSQKPSEVIEAIGRMFPTQKRMELFSRKAISGWNAWGLELCKHSEPSSFIEVAALDTHQSAG